MSKTIIIGDDDELLLYSYARILKKAGFRVFTAINGEEVLDLTKKESPDLVISDIIMPIMHGFDLVKTIKHDQTMKHIRVILISSIIKSDNYKKQAEEAGADGFIDKPINNSELLDFVNRFLEN